MNLKSPYLSYDLIPLFQIKNKVWISILKKDLDNNIYKVEFLSQDYIVKIKIYTKEDFYKLFAVVSDIKEDVANNVVITWVKTVSESKNIQIFNYSYSNFSKEIIITGKPNCTIQSEFQRFLTLIKL